MRLAQPLYTSPPTLMANVQESAPRRLFDHAESELFARALFLLGQKAPDDSMRISDLIAQLAEITDIIAKTPSLRRSSRLGGVERDETTLINHLTHLDGLGGELDLPLKAELQRTFLVGKIQFLRAFVKAVSGVAQNPELRVVNVQLREELAQSIYTQMAEELLLALVRKPEISAATKVNAATQLVNIWDEATLEIDQFCPLLESAWRARNHVNAGLGCLLGTSEYFRLVAQDCDPQFLDFFLREEVSEAENQAFSEFLFGVTYEELEKLRAMMRSQSLEVVSEEWASAVLGRTFEHSCNEKEPSEIDPVSLYRSYSRRQLAADFRIIAGSPGPRRTAEAYLMIYLLNQPENQAIRPFV